MRRWNFFPSTSPVAPNARALAVAQDRLAEKNFLSELGIATAPYAGVSNAEDAADAVLRAGRAGGDQDAPPGLRRQGPADRAHAISTRRRRSKRCTRVPAIAEEFIDFAFEASVIAARGRDGSVCRLRSADERAREPHPAPLDRALAARARAGRRGQSHRAAHRRGARLCGRARRWSCSSPRTASFWSTRSRRACTIPATGRSRPASPRSSNSTSARWPAGRWAIPRAIRMR